VEVIEDTIKRFPPKRWVLLGIAHEQTIDEGTNKRALLEKLIKARSERRRCVLKD
jgi:hypothetical protein